MTVQFLQFDVDKNNGQQNRFKPVSKKAVITSNDIIAEDGR